MRKCEVHFEHFLSSSSIEINATMYFRIQQLFQQFFRYSSLIIGVIFTFSPTACNLCVLSFYSSASRALVVVPSCLGAIRQPFHPHLVLVRVLLVKHLHLLHILHSHFVVKSCVDRVHLFYHFVQSLVAFDVVFVPSVFHVCVFAPQLRFGSVEKALSDLWEKRGEDAPSVRFERFFQRNYCFKFGEDCARSIKMFFGDFLGR